MTGIARLITVLALMGVVLGGLAFFRWETEAPEILAEKEVWVGREGREIAFEVVDERSGLRRLDATLVTAKGERPLLQTEGGNGLLFGTGDEGKRGEFTVSLAPATTGIPDGDAVLRITATDWSWAGFLRGNTTVVSIPVTIDTKSPRITVATGLTYVKRAGSSSVVYSLNEEPRLDGVMVDETFFRGFPASESEPLRRVAVFAVARDAPKEPRIRVIALDRAGNRASSGWATRLQERQFERTPIRLPDRFLEQKVPELAEALGMPAGDPIETFQQINSQVRATNEAKIRELSLGASGPRRWEGAFSQMRNSKVTSRFAEHRTYSVDGREVSQAIHYGYDLASTARAPITASNAGVVIFADDLGIYGQCVLIDHGLGVTTLYGHLSRIDVSPGEEVEKNQVLGTSGATGLAGGDHLHFAILVGGVYVDPLEWWDPRWMRDHISRRIADASP